MDEEEIERRGRARDLAYGIMILIRNLVFGRGLGRNVDMKKDFGLFKEIAGNVILKKQDPNLYLDPFYDEVMVANEQEDERDINAFKRIFKDFVLRLKPRDIGILKEYLGSEDCKSQFRFLMDATKTYKKFLDAVRGSVETGGIGGRRVRKVKACWGENELEKIRKKMDLNEEGFRELVEGLYGMKYPDVARLKGQEMFDSLCCKLGISKEEFKESVKETVDEAREALLDGVIENRIMPYLKPAVKEGLPINPLEIYAELAWHLGLSPSPSSIHKKLEDYGHKDVVDLLKKNGEINRYLETSLNWENLSFVERGSVLGQIHELREQNENKDALQIAGMLAKERPDLFPEGFRKSHVRAFALAVSMLGEEGRKALTGRESPEIIDPGLPELREGLDHLMGLMVHKWAEGGEISLKKAEGDVKKLAENVRDHWNAIHPRPGGYALYGFNTDVVRDLREHVNDVLALFSGEQNKIESLKKKGLKPEVVNRYKIIPFQRRIGLPERLETDLHLRLGLKGFGDKPKEIGIASLREKLNKSLAPLKKMEVLNR